MKIRKLFWNENVQARNNKQRFNNKEEKTMFKRLILIGGLVISMVAMSATSCQCAIF